MQHQQTEARPEQATLLTVLAANLDLAVQDGMTEAQADLALRQAAQAAQHLIETSNQWTHPSCLDPAACASCSGKHKRERA